MAPNQQQEAPSTDPLDLAGLRLTALQKRRELGRARRTRNGFPVLLAGLGWLLARLGTLRPMRVLKLYSLRHGPLMAAGSAYNMFFSIAALLVSGFAVLGLVLAGNQALRGSVVDTVAKAVPGLIDTGGGGLATPEKLFASEGAFGLTLAISSAVMIVTSLGWIGGLREGIRGIFDLPPAPGNPVLIKLKDAGTLLVLGAALLLTTAVGFVSSVALDFIIALLRLDEMFAGPLTVAAGILVMLLLDTVVAVILFKVASAVTLPRAVLIQSALIAGAGSTVLRMFSTVLLGNVGNNPLLAPFAVILGLFVWFYLLSQVYLLAAAWGAVGAADVRARTEQRHALSLRQRAVPLRAEKT